MGFRDSRRWRRFDTETVLELKGWLEDRSSTDEWLANISEGGAGFYSRQPLGTIRVERVISCWFDFKPTIPEQIHIQGRIVHVTELKKDGAKLLCYGIEFLDTERIKVRPIIEELERRFDGELGHS